MCEIYSTKVHISLASQTCIPGEFGQIPTIILFLTYQEFLGVLIGLVMNGAHSDMLFGERRFQRKMEDLPLQNASQFMFTPTSLGVLSWVCNNERTRHVHAQSKPHTGNALHIHRRGQIEFEAGWMKFSASVVGKGCNALLKPTNLSKARLATFHKLHHISLPSLSFASLRLQPLSVSHHSV